MASFGLVDDRNAAIWGNQQNTSVIPAYMLNRNAENEIDWNAVLTGGIRGAAQGALMNMVGEKFQSGQLRDPNAVGVQAQASGNLTMLLVIGGLAYLILK
jgi:hypothetical protein